MKIMMTPCFYCDSPAEYSGTVEKVQEVLKVVEVCKDHFVFPGSS